ncbi:Centrosomal protein [Armadillidium nasatum]|uniref:Centrosomal protein of 19 kDa n=1 Tax=Armadillidium nasatum TaxID=96803 RepID=A0A5N5SW56_9CRUS|nr:Centrosomal protein [Armadillidium nasatum]
MLRILQEVQKGSPVEKASDLVRQQYMIDPNQDLNKLTEEELTTKKKLMETSFLKNQVKKGDEGFQYDIQVNFR